MNTLGTIWFDETKKQTARQAIESAIASHIHKFGIPPDFIYVPRGCSCEANVPVIEQQNVLEFHYQAFHRVKK